MLHAWRSFHSIYISLHRPPSCKPIEQYYKSNVDCKRPCVMKCSCQYSEGDQTHSISPRSQFFTLFEPFPVLQLITIGRLAVNCSNLLNYSWVVTNLYFHPIIYHFFVIFTSFIQDSIVASNHFISLWNCFRFRMQYSWLFTCTWEILPEVTSPAHSLLRKI